MARSSIRAVTAGVASTALLAGLPGPALATSAPRPAGHVAKVSVRAPGPLLRGRPTALRVTVSNTTRRTLGGLVLRVRPPVGVTVRIAGARRGRLTRTLAPLKRRGRLAMTVTLTPGAAAKATSTLRLTVARKRTTVAQASVKLRVRTAPPPPGPPRPPGPAPTQPAPSAPANNALVGRYFWSSYNVGAATYYLAYYFANNGFAYRGTPAGGLPSCPAATAQGDGDGCIPYAYDPASGALTLGTTAGSVSGAHTINVDGRAYGEASTPAAGARYDAFGENYNGSGICPSACTLVATGLRLAADGRFARSAAVEGSTTEGDFAALPPDQHGSYAVLDSGRIEFTYTDGHVVTATLGVMLNASDAPDPNYGLLLDGRAYFGPASGA